MWLNYFLYTTQHRRVSFELQYFRFSQKFSSKRRTGWHFDYLFRAFNVILSSRFLKEYTYLIKTSIHVLVHFHWLLPCQIYCKTNWPSLTDCLSIFKKSDFTWILISQLTFLRNNLLPMNQRTMWRSRLTAVRIRRWSFVYESFLSK